MSRHTSASFTSSSSFLNAAHSFIVYPERYRYFMRAFVISSPR